MRRDFDLAGFEPEAASRLAREEAIDLHALLDLIDHGCPPHLAARILAPLDSGQGTVVTMAPLLALARWSRPHGTEATPSAESRS